MRKISANYIFPVTSKPIKNGIIVIDDNGAIVEIINSQQKEIAGVEFYNGVIVPGFVNTHCHLELSYLKDKIPEKIGHIQFIEQIVERINTIQSDISKIIEADKQMQKEGIVAVGDISNKEITAEIKRNSSIYYHTFVEIADFFNKKTMKKRLVYAEHLRSTFLFESIAPHSPYTSSLKLMKNIAKIKQETVSVHNQEAPSENEFYLSASGKMADFMRERGLIDELKSTEKSSLQSYLPLLLNDDKNIILVHNLYTSQDDIKFAENSSKNIYWTFCPNSNIYIQDKLPKIQLFIENKCKITLGTDSLATNNRLSIIEEMKRFIKIDFLEVLKWATINGAEALKVNDKFGSLEVGKKPGINLITNFNFNTMNLTEKSRVKKLT